MGQAAFIDDVEAALEHLLGLGWEARDQVGTEHHVRPQGTDAPAEVYGFSMHASWPGAVFEVDR